MKINKLLESKIRESNETEVLWRNRNRSIIKDGYGFGIDNGVTVNRFHINNDGKVVYDYEPPNTIKTTIDRLIRQGKFNNPHYSENPKYVGNTLKYGRGVEEAFEKDGGPFWYFTKHGIGPGMLPKGVNVVDTKEDDNFGTYIALDKVLTTQELKDYELKEKKPDVKEGFSHFEFTSGTNPYIAKTKDEAERIKRSRGDSAKFVGSINGIDYYKVDDEEKDLFSVDESFKPTDSGIQSVKVYNPYNYTIQELRVDNDNKTFERGNFTAGKADKKTKNRQEFEDVVDTLKELGYTEIKSDYRSMRNKSRKGVLKELDESKSIKTFGAKGKKLNEFTQDTVTRYQVEYFIDENDDSDTPLETYVYTDSKREAIAKVKEEYPNAQIVYCVSETVPGNYKKWDMNESIEKGTPITLWWKDDEWSKDAPSYASCEYIGKTRDGKHKFVSTTYGHTFIVDFKTNTITTPQGKTFDLDTSSGWTKKFNESVTHCVYFTQDGIDQIEFEGSEDECNRYISDIQAEQDDEFGDEAPERFIKRINEDTAISSRYEFDDDIDDLSYYYDDEVFNNNLENSPYTEIASKSVLDSDGFMTDYTMYMNINTGEYVFVFGDKDVYSPEDGYFDWECETKEEAEEWFDNYHGFDDSDDDIDWMNEEISEEESPIVHTKPDGTYLVKASSGDGYTAFNKSNVCAGHISATNDNEAKSKFNSNQFDEEFKNK